MPGTPISWSSVSRNRSIRRIFPDWSMKTVNLDAASHLRLLPLKTLMQAVFDQQQIIDKMVWTIERTLKHEFQ